MSRNPPSPPVWEAVVNGDQIGTYDPVEKITIHLKDGYTYDLIPMECTQLVCRVKKET
jgi:hypothetical protein